MSVTELAEHAYQLTASSTGDWMSGVHELHSENEMQMHI